jgi:hypothetical protein
VPGADARDRLVEIATSEHLQASNIELPSRFASEPGVTIERVEAHRSLRPVLVLRDGVVIAASASLASLHPLGRVADGLKAPRTTRR